MDLLKDEVVRCSSKYFNIYMMRNWYKVSENVKVQFHEQWEKFQILYVYGCFVLCEIKDMMIYLNWGIGTTNSRIYQNTRLMSNLSTYASQIMSIIMFY